jgi:hypothetical protein
MIEIDWGDLAPARDVRERIEARVVELKDLTGPVVALRRRGSGYEAELRALHAPEELRLHGDDLAGLAERAVALLAFVAQRRAD